MLAVCDCGMTHRLDRDTLTSVQEGIAEQFLSEIKEVTYVKGVYGGRNYPIGDRGVDSYHYLNFFRRASGGEIYCDLITIHKCAPAADDLAPVEDRDHFKTLDFGLIYGQKH